MTELRALNEYLSSHGPYVGGASVCATDLSLAPKLHHMDVALRELRGGWEMPPDACGEVRAYLGRMRARPSWAATAYGDELVVKGWAPKLAAA